MPGYFEIINRHTVSSLTIPRASIKWVQLWELRAHTLNMHSYSNAYINILTDREWPAYSKHTAVLQLFIW